MMAKVCHFYGISPLEYEDLDIKTALDLFQCISIIKAQDFFYLADISAYPHVKPSGARKMIEKYSSKGRKFYNTRKRTKPTMDDVMKQLGGLIGHAR